MRWIWMALSIGVAMILGASFAGEHFPPGDSLAVIRLPLTLLLLALAMLIRRMWVGRVLLAGVVVSLAAFIGPRLPQSAPEGAELVIYQKNMLYFEADRSALVADIHATGPHLVMLQEVSDPNRSVMEALRPDFPHQLMCPGRGIRGVVLLSRIPMRNAECSLASGSAMARISWKGQEVELASVHLTWPWPHPQPHQVPRILRELGARSDAVAVVAGDFNMVPEGSAVRRIAEVIDGDRVGPVRRTFVIYGVPLAIDHVMVTGGVGTSEVRPRFGSDHFGVLARVKLPAARP